MAPANSKRTRAKTKPSKRFSPVSAAPATRDTSLEDIDIFDSLLQSKTPRRTKDDEIARLAQLMAENSPSIKSALNEWQTSTYQRENNFAGFFPTLDLTTTLGQKQEDPRFTGTTNDYGNITLGVTEVLYDNGATWTKYDIAKRTEERLRLDYEHVRDQTLLQVTKSYLDWSQSLQAQDLDGAKRKILRRQFDFVESQYRQGIKSRRDVLRLESELRRVQLDQLHRDTEIKINRAKLIALLGITEEAFDAELFRGEDVGALDEPAENTDTPIKLSDHRRLKILRLKEAEAGLNIRLAQRDFWPRLELRADANYTNDQFLQPGRRFDTNYAAYWQALAVVSWTIFDFGVRSRNIQIERIKTDTVKQKNRQEEYDLEVQLQQVWRTLVELKEALTMTHELMTLERQNYNALENDYRNGRAGYLDLIGGINFYIDARTRFMNSYYDLRRQKLTYDFHGGDLFARLTE